MRASESRRSLGIFAAGLALAATVLMGCSSTTSVAPPRTIKAPTTSVSVTWKERVPQVV